MTSDEFMRKAVGLPWIDRACSWAAMDCWGVVIMFFRHVHDAELPVVEGYESGDKSISAGFIEQLQSGLWVRVDGPVGTGIAFTSYINGVPAHVGVVIDGKYVLHSAGNENHEGQVRCDRLESFTRLHRNIEFYQYLGCR